MVLVLMLLLLFFIFGFLTAVLLLRPELLRAPDVLATLRESIGWNAVPVANQIGPKSLAPAAAKRPAYSLKLADEYTAQHSYIKDVEKALESVLKTAAQDLQHWQQFDEREQVKFLKQDVGSAEVPLLRGETTIDAPPMALLQIIVDDENDNSFDPLLKRKVSVEHLDDQTDIFYTEFKGMGPIAGRDFCILRHYRRLPNAGLVVFNTSVEHPNVAQIEGKGNVRGTTPFNGYVIRPSPADEGKSSEVRFVSLSNLNGSLPKFALRQAFRIIPERVVVLKRLAALNNLVDTDEVSDYNQAIIDRSTQAIDQLESDAVNTTCWTLAMSKHGVQIFRYKDGQHLKYKGEGVVHVPFADVKNAVTNVEHFHEWDKFCKEASVVTKLDSNTRIVYTLTEITKCFMVQTRRDFCTAMGHTTRADGTFIQAALSVEHPKCPPRTDCVRNNLVCGGWILSPIAGGSLCKATYLCHLENTGGVPQYIIDKVAVKLPLTIYALEKFLQGRIEVASCAAR